MKKIKIFLLGFLAAVLTSHMSYAGQAEAEYEVIIKDVRQQYNKVDAAYKNKAALGVEGLKDLRAEIRKTNQSLTAFIKKYSNSPEASEGTSILKMQQASLEKVEKLIESKNRTDETPRPPGIKAPPENNITYAELDRMVHVGMKLGKIYRVVARHVSHGPVDALKPIEERDANGLMITDSQIISTAALTQAQRGDLYDLGKGIGCFSVSLVESGKLELMDVKKGACE